MRDMEKKKKTDAEFDRKCFHYTISVSDDTGIPEALRFHCEKNGISINSFIAESIAEKLSRMDVHSLSIAEIMEIERGDDNETSTYW